jgi:phosphoglycolate phosphatase-like HAD superfamily hydrolase
MNKVIVVDLDGTLIDSGKRSFHLFKHLTKSPIEFHEYCSLKRSGIRNQFILKERLGWSPMLIGEFDEKWSNLIEAPEWLQFDHLFPFATDALKRMITCGYDLWLVTARHNQLTLYDQLEKFGIKKFFEKIVMNEGQVSKAAALLNAIESRTIDWVVGDTEEEVKISRQLSCRSVLVTSGARSQAFLKQAGAELIMNSIIDFASSLPR